MIARLGPQTGRRRSLFAVAVCASALACSPQSGRLDESVGDGRDRAGPLATEGNVPGGLVDGGGRYPLSVSPQVWAERQKLFANGDSAGNFFGGSVSLDGDTALLGAAGDYASGSWSGSAHIFVRSAATWTRQQEIFASDGATDDHFGRSVSLSGDTALVGAYGDDDAGSGSGSAYIFVRSATTWTQQQKLLADDGQAVRRLGDNVSLSGDTALLGAIGHDAAGSWSGAAYVFTRSATTWTQQQKLLASDSAEGDYFGGSVALSGDTALLGAYGDDDAGSWSGSAYVFTRSATTWTQQQKLLASDGAADDYFGGSASLSGETALVGGNGNSDAGTSSGAAYVFVRSAAIWTEQQKLLANDGAASDRFGTHGALAGDTALVGAPNSDDAGSLSGSAYVFTRSATTWTEQRKLLASDGAASDYLGRRVALSGTTALLGAWGDDDTASEAGAAYVFALRLVTGQPCDSDAACASTSCADGFCCDSACQGACEACNVAGVEGACTLADRGSAPTAACNGHLCNGTVGNCSSDCASDQDCNSAFHCPNALGCVPKEPNGERCGSESVCDSAHCVDGICCDEACDQGCGSCVAPGREGACAPLEEGHPGTPSCAPYLCGGADAACPNSCQRHIDCARESHCDEGACQLDGGQGAACGEGDACTTGHCTDGVCCLAESCGAYRCGAGGTCQEACSSSAQCASGHQCNSDGKCEPQPAVHDAANEVGACRLVGPSAAARGPGSWRGFGALAWLACLALARRRQPDKRSG